MTFLSEGDRQKRTGWLLIIVAGLYALWFLKARLLIDGPAITNKEWATFMSMTMCFFIGTMNVRMAAQRAEKRKREELNKTSA